MRIHWVTTKKHYLLLTFRSLAAIFIIRNWYSVPPRLDVTISCRIAKAVVGVSELITVLVLIHGLMTFLLDVHCFFDPPGRSVWFSVDHCSLHPVDHVVLLSGIFGKCGLLIFRKTGCAMTSDLCSCSLTRSFLPVFGCGLMNFDSITLPTEWIYLSQWISCKLR